MQHAGVPVQLECLIRSKVVRAASGDTRELFKDFSLKVSAGDVLGIVGPSGCGKTTLLRMFAGLDREFDGEIAGLSYDKISMVFQEPHLLPWRDVEQNIEIFAPALAQEERRSLLDRLGLSGHLRHFPGELSLGLARRVAIARALAIQPKLLILDEPFTSLDRALALRLRDELAQLFEEKCITVLLVTHDTSDAIALSDRVAVISGNPARLVANIAVMNPRQKLTSGFAQRLALEINEALANAAVF